MNLIQYNKLKTLALCSTFGKSSTEPNFKLHLLRLEMQALYKRRENLWFAVVNMQSDDYVWNSPGTLIIYFFSLTHCIAFRRRRVAVLHA
jgi:hypothetical protein